MALYILIIFTEQLQTNAMTLIESISNYVNDCLDDKSLGFRTYFRTGKIVSTHVYYHLSIMIVNIEGKAAKQFNITDRSQIIEYIYSSII